MRAWHLVGAVLAVTALAGCVETGDATSCPGHVHVALLVADGDEPVPYASGGDGQAEYPSPGVHMHADDGLLHIHPQEKTCVTYSEALAAVGVVLEEGAATVDGQRLSGTLLLEVQPWNGTWQALRPDAAVGDGARALVAIDPEDVDALRSQVPPIPPAYEPAAS